MKLNEKGFLQKVENDETFHGYKKETSWVYLNIQFESEMDKVGLLGASGSGKSMTLRCLAGIDTPDSGRVILNGKILFDSQRGINLPCRQRNIGFLFQNYALFPNMTVEENISFGLEQKNRDEKRTIIKNMIRMIRLEGLEKRYPHQLSGGQQQRVALARALAVEPEAILLEPFSALDEHLRSHMIQQLLDTMAGYQGVMIFVTHNMEEVYKICNELTILSEGQIEARGGNRRIILSSPLTCNRAINGM